MNKNQSACEAMTRAQVESVEEAHAIWEMDSHTANACENAAGFIDDIADAAEYAITFNDVYSWEPVA
jgi:hypothetical protein